MNLYKIYNSYYILEKIKTIWYIIHILFWNTIFFKEWAFLPRPSSLASNTFFHEFLLQYSFWGDLEVEKEFIFDLQTL